MWQEDAKAILCKVLYKIFNIKEKTTTPESKDPIEVNAVCFSGRHSTVNHRFYKLSTKLHNAGHMQAPSHDKLMRSREYCYCYKKGHYMHNCHTRCQATSHLQEAVTIHSMRSSPDTGILPINQLTKRIQENQCVNSFNALKEEDLDKTIPVAPAPKLLDQKKLEELVATFKAKQLPVHTPSPLKVKMVQEFIKDNAHKFDETTHKQLANLCKPKLKPSAQQMGDTLKNQIPYMYEDTNIRTLNMLIPTAGFNIQKIETLAKTFSLDTVFVNRSNSVQVPIIISSHKQESTITALLNTGAMESFINKEALTWLRLGTKNLLYKQLAYNVDGTINTHRSISQYCNLLVKAPRSLDSMTCTKLNL